MIMLNIVAYNMSCSYSECSSKAILLCDNCNLEKLFCIEHAELYKSELNHSLRALLNSNQFRVRSQFKQNNTFRSSMNPANQSEMSYSMRFSSNQNTLGSRNQSNKIVIRESVSEFLATSESVILAVRMISCKKIKMLRKGRGSANLSFDINKLIKILSEQGIVEQGSRFCTSQEFEDIQFDLDKKQQRINELEKMTVEFNRNSQNLYELSTTISNMKQKDEKLLNSKYLH